MHGSVIDDVSIALNFRPVRFAINSESWMHKLANLMLLTLRKNTQASNWNFAVKKDRYFSESGGVSPFVITTEVLGETAWTPAVPEARQTALLARLYATWDIGPAT